MKKRIGLVVVPFALLPLTAQASDGRYPGVGMDYASVFQYDYSRAVKGQPGQTTTDGYFDISTVMLFRFSPDDQIWLATEINPVTPPPPGQKRWLDGTGFTVNDVNWYHQGHDSTFRIGKFQIPFGRAQSAAPGLYTQNIVAAYDLDGMLGGGYEYRFFSDAMGTIAPSLSVYSADTSFLSRPYFQHAAQAGRSDGGPSNTGSPNSYAAVVNWLAPAALPFLEVQAGYMSNHKGDATSAGIPATEIARTISLRYMLAQRGSTDLGMTLSGHYLDIVPFVEYVDVQNENAIRGNDTSYLTTSLTVDYGRLAFGLTRTDKHLTPVGAASSREYLTEASVVYHATGLIDLTFSGGRQKQAGVTSNLIGLAVTLNGAF